MFHCYRKFPLYDTSSAAVVLCNSECNIILNLVESNQIMVPPYHGCIQELTIQNELDDLCWTYACV